MMQNRSPILTVKQHAMHMDKRCSSDANAKVYRKVFAIFRPFFKVETG